MRSFTAILTTSLLTYALAAPVPEKESSTRVVVSVLEPIVPIISEPEPTPGTVLLLPPPLFDPSEPRPASLFDSSNPSQSNLRAPPIQEARTETLLPFTAAHVHPFTTPYTPENLPGTCAFSPRCRLAQTSAEIGVTLLFLISVVYMIIHLVNKLIRKVIWTAKTRARSPSGSLRLEPELGNKLSESQQLASDATMTMTNPLVKVWSEKGLEKVVVFSG